MTRALQLLQRVRGTQTAFPMLPMVPRVQQYQQYQRVTCRPWDRCWEAQAHVVAAANGCICLVMNIFGSNSRMYAY